MKIKDQIMSGVAMGIVLAILASGIGATREVTLQGKSSIHDGDTLRVSGQSVRLNGIDAEELDEPNGILARDTLRAIVGGNELRCALTGARSYNRVVGGCYLPDGSDIGAELIRRGLALDCARYSHGKYRALESVGARQSLIQKGYC